MKSKLLVTGDIFSYEELKKKALREIARLEEAEKKLDQQAAIDHALNAAFSIYHLLEWKSKTLNPNKNVSAHFLCENSNNLSLQMLHNIVTCNKHVTVSNSSYNKDLSVAVSAKITFLTTEDGRHLTTQKEDSFVTEDSCITIKFDNQKAVDVLKAAYNEFA